MLANRSMEAFAKAFNQRDSEAILSLLRPAALFELPLLGQRLVGREEIRVGLERTFTLTESCLLELDHVHHAGLIAIAEGRLQAKLHRVSSATTLPMALVVEGAEDAVARISVYLDTRGQRLWTDSPLFVDPQGASER